MKRVWNTLSPADIESIKSMISGNPKVLPPDPEMYLYEGERLQKLLEKKLSSTEEDGAFLAELTAGFLENPMVYADETPSLQQLADMRQQNLPLWEGWYMNKLSRERLGNVIAAFGLIGINSLELNGILTEYDLISREEMPARQKEEAKIPLAQKADRTIRSLCIQIIES